MPGPQVEVDDTQYASIVDQTSTASTTYVCEAAPGSRTQDAVWRISRLNTTTGQLTYADGNANFDNIADNRAGLTYA